MIYGDVDNMSTDLYQEEIKYLKARVEVLKAAIANEHAGEARIFKQAHNDELESLVSILRPGSALHIAAILEIRFRKVDRAR
jgi:hypothetical protein